VLRPCPAAARNTPLSGLQSVFAAAGGGKRPGGVFAQAPACKAPAPVPFAAWGQARQFGAERSVKKPGNPFRIAGLLQCARRPNCMFQNQWAAPARILRGILRETGQA